MISADIVKLSLEEFMNLVEKYEDEAVQEYKKKSLAMRSTWIQFWIPMKENQCRKCYIDELKNKYYENGWKQVDINFVQEKNITYLMILLWA